MIRGAGPATVRSTVGDSLRVAAGPGFPAGLLAAGGLERITAIADQLPGHLTSTFGFEIELGRPAGSADFALAVTALHGGREILAGASAADPPLPGPDDGVWGVIAALSRAWSVPGSALDVELHNLALEFDLLEGSQGVPAPNLFLGARTGILPPKAGHPGQIELPLVGSTAWLLDDALPLLGRRLPPAQRDSLLRCFEALPQGSRAFQVGVMLGPPIHALRVCVLGLDYRRVADYLGRIGWPGDLSELDSRLGPLAASSDSVVLDVDVGETVLPSLAVECFAGEDGDPGLGERWARFLDPLVEAGLCLPERRQPLLEWPLVIRESEAAGWPPHLREASGFVGGEVEGSLVRAINHVKLGWSPGGLQAKAYLRVQHRWRPVPPPAPGPV
jgi:hypothetical protein